MSKSRPGVRRRALERIFHRAIDTRGLADAGDILARATAAELRELADLDLWSTDRPGETEAFDADRFAMWLEVLVEIDQARAAEQLAALDRDLATIGLARHLRVFDYAAVAEFETTGSELVASRHPRGCPTVEIGGFVIAARGNDAWDAIVTVLVNLETDHPAAFHEVMRGVCGLSNSDPELDELDSLPGVQDQLEQDVRTARDERREHKGYVTAADARAFLQASRNVHVEAPTALSPTVPILVAPASSRALVAMPERDNPRLGWIRDRMQHLADHFPGPYASRNADLTWLANALVAGCSIQGRPFAVQEAWDAAVATCNLALERVAPPVEFLVDHDLIRVFQAGWTILHDDVVTRAADELACALAKVHCHDAFLQADVDALGRALTMNLRAGAPWHARDRMDVIASLDAIAWTGLLGLVAEYPVRHAAVGAARKGTLTVSPSAFELISQQAMIDEIHAFLAALPAWFGNEA